MNIPDIENLLEREDMAMSVRCDLRKWTQCPWTDST